MSEAIHGGCLCGAATFVVEPPLPRMIHCHCSRCRKGTGTDRSWIGNRSLVFRSSDRRELADRAPTTFGALADPWRPATLPKPSFGAATRSGKIRSARRTIRGILNDLSRRPGAIGRGV